MALSVDNELVAWAKIKGITRQTLAVLEDQGVASFQSLANLDMALLELCDLLPRHQCELLTEAIRELETGSDVELSMLCLQTDANVTAASTPPLTSAPLHPSDRDAIVRSLSSMSSVRISPADTVRFILVGKTGCGKSTTGNTILGQELFRNAVCFSSVTSTCSHKSTERNGIGIEITDSPGLCDTKRPPEDVASEVLQAVACMHPGPTAILYVITVGRYTEEDHGVYERVKSLFDPEVTQYIIIVFTRGDELKREGKSIEDVLSTAPDNFRAVLRECGHRYVVFDNTARDKQPQVDRLLQEVRRLSHTHAGKPYTCPRYAEVGEKLEEELRRRLQAVEEKELKRKKYVQELEEKMKRGRELAEKEKRDFERKEAEREKTARKMEEEREKKMADLLQLVQEQKLSAEKQKEEEKKLHKRMQQERKDFRRQMEADRKQELEIIEKRNEERERLLREKESALAAEREASRRFLEAQEEELRRLKEHVASLPARESSSCCIL